MEKKPHTLLPARYWREDDPPPLSPNTAQLREVNGTRPWEKSEYIWKIGKLKIRPLQKERTNEKYLLERRTGNISSRNWQHRCPRYTRSTEAKQLQKESFKLFHEKGGISKKIIQKYQECKSIEQQTYSLISCSSRRNWTQPSRPFRQRRTRVAADTASR